MPNLRRRVQRWLYQPLGGPTAQELREADPEVRARRAEEQRRAETERRRAAEEIQWVDEEPQAQRPTTSRWPTSRGRGSRPRLDPPVAPAGPPTPPVLLATLVVEAHPLNDAAQREALGVLGNVQDEIAAVAARALAESFDDAVTVGGVQVSEGSIRIAVPAFLHDATLPADVVAGLARAAAEVRNWVMVNLGGMIGWASGTFAPGPAFGAGAQAAAAAAPPADDGAAKIGAWLAGGLAFLAAILAAVKVSDSDLAHVRLNHPVWVTLLLGVIVFASVLGVLWPAWQARKGVKRIVMLGLGLLAFLVALAAMGIVGLANDSLSEEIKPRIAAKVTGEAGKERLTGTVTSDGLPNGRFLRVGVYGFDDDNKETLLMIEQTGADRDGKVAVDVDMGADAKRFASLSVRAVTVRKQYINPPKPDCESLADKVACLRLQLRPKLVPDPKPDVGRPRLSATWKMVKGHAPILSVHARASGLTPGDRLLLSVRPPIPAGDEDESRGRIFAATWAAEADGTVDERADVPVAASKAQLCVILRGLPGAGAAKGDGAGAPKGVGYGPCHPRRRGIAVLIGRPPV